MVCPGSSSNGHDRDLAGNCLRSGLALDRMNPFVARTHCLPPRD
jgi:hypothetical protein